MTLKFPLGSGLYQPQVARSPFALGSGLYGQAPLGPPKVVPSPAGVVQQAPKAPGLNERIGGLFDNPQFLLGLSLLGGARTANPYGELAQTAMTLAQMKANSKKAQEERELEERKLKQAADLAEANRALEERRAAAYERQVGVSEQQAGIAEQELAQQAPLRAAQTNLYGAQAQNYGTEAGIKQQQAAQEAAWNKFIMEQVGQGGIFGGGHATPQGGTLQQQSLPMTQGDIQAPQSGAVGRYGTPAWILDGIEHTESRGKADAVGPLISPQLGRAKGAYQFTDQTVEHLRNKGVEFDPMNRDQARDAADFYLQELIKQNGGDINAALAAYGGHSKVNPAPYINKVYKAGGQQPPQAPAPQGGANPYELPMATARLGALAGLAGKKGAPQLMDLAKMQQPQTEQPGTFRVDPQTGIETFRRDPYKEAGLGLQERGVGVQESAEGRALRGETREVAKEQKVAGEQLRTKQTELEGQLAKSDDALTRITEVLEHPGLKDATGLTGIVARKIPGTPTYDVAAKVESLKADKTLEVLKELKAAGATLGYNPTDKDAKIMEAAGSILDMNQSDPAFRNELAKLQGAIQRTRDGIAKRQKELSGMGDIGAAPPGPATSVLTPEEFLQKRAAERQKTAESAHTPTGVPRSGITEQALKLIPQGSALSRLFGGQ